MCNQTGVVELLRQSNASVNAASSGGQSEGLTALHIGARNGSAAVCQLLLENAAEVTAPDNCGRQALARAAGAGHLATVRCLLGFKAHMAPLLCSGAPTR
jgi:ankyrin repeat protein